MLRNSHSSLALIFLLPVLACAAESGDPAPGETASGTLSERLQDPVELGVLPTDGGSFARLKAVTLSDGKEIEVEILVVDGTLAIELDDSELRVDGLEVNAADVEVGSGVMPPEGATFTSIAIALASPLRALLADVTDSSARVEARLPVEVRWAVALDHGVVDLAPIRFSELDFELTVELDDDGAIAAHLTAAQPGPFWTWAGIFELRDLEVALLASTEQSALDLID